MLNHNPDRSMARQADLRLSFLGEFASKDCEAQYRQYELQANKQQARLVLIVVIVGIAFFTLSDYILFGITAPFALLLSVRLVLILASLALSWALKREFSLRQFERIGLSYLLGLTAGIIYIQATRPPGYIAYAILSVLIICVFYMASPLPLRLQAIPALLLSLGTVLLLVKSSLPLDKLSNIAIIYGVVCANLIGAIVSLQAHYWKRQQFAALSRETRLCQELARAMEEIRTLRGTIPICSYCKNIKNEPGDWQKIEAYISLHTDAVFSHGICPECFAKHFSNYAKSSS
jgi:hypothetical protein